MRHNPRFRLLLAAAALGVAACTDATSPAPSIVSDADVTADVVASSGDAIARDVGDLIGNELSVGAALPVAGGFDLFPSPANLTRSRICYDAQNVAQTQCDPVTTAKIVFQLAVDENVNRSFTGLHGTETMTLAIHRARLLTISGLAGQETSRIHDGWGASHDTTTFVGTRDTLTLTRLMFENSTDSIQTVIFNLPHGSNPWPVSGTIVRNVSGTADITLGDRHESRSYTRRVTVTFPADNQGNVVITINAKTCMLNLVTHAVTACTP